MVGIYDKCSGVKCGEVFGLDGVGEITVYDDVHDIVQHFRDEDLALFHIQTRICRNFELR